MLTNKKISIESKCVVNDVEIAAFRAVFIPEDANSMAFHHYQMDREACKIHRKELREDQAAFDDYAYELHEEMLNK